MRRRVGRGEHAAQEVAVLAGELEEAARRPERDLDGAVGVSERARSADRLVDRVVDHREAVDEHGAEQALQIGEVVVDELAADTGGLREADDRQPVDAFATGDLRGGVEQLAAAVLRAQVRPPRRRTSATWLRSGCGRHWADLTGGWWSSCGERYLQTVHKYASLRPAPGGGVCTENRGGWGCSGRTGAGMTAQRLGPRPHGAVCGQPWSGSQRRGLWRSPRRPRSPRSRSRRCPARRTRTRRRRSASSAPPRPTSNR